MPPRFAATIAIALSIASRCTRGRAALRLPTKQSQTRQRNRASGGRGLPVRRCAAPGAGLPNWLSPVAAGGRALDRTASDARQRRLFLRHAACRNGGRACAWQRGGRDRHRPHRRRSAFARDAPQAIVDWGWRAVHLTVVAAKALTTRFYGRPPTHSYFDGCSTGGHQAMMEAQRFPADFDGIVAGAPGANRVRLNAAFLWQYLANHRAGDDATPILDAADLTLLHRHALSVCRSAGNAADRWLVAPLSCQPDPQALQCKPGKTFDCLSREKIAAARRLYGAHAIPRPESSSPSLPPWQRNRLEQLLGRSTPTQSACAARVFGGGGHSHLTGRGGMPTSAPYHPRSGTPVLVDRRHQSRPQRLPKSGGGSCCNTTASPTQSCHRSTRCTIARQSSDNSAPMVCPRRLVPAILDPRHGPLRR